MLLEIHDMNDKFMKILILMAICLCCFTGAAKATKQEAERLIIGEETFWMYTLPMAKDSVLSRELQKRLSGRISIGLYRGYMGTWRLENGKFISEKVEEMSEDGGYQEVDISGIFDAYRKNGRIVARWQIADDQLWLVGIRNAHTEEVIPLSVLAPGNNGEPVEASWYTGTFEIAKGEVLGQGYPLSRAEKREVVCEVVRGRVVRQAVYDNYIQPGDSVTYNHFVQVIRSHDWDCYPELKGRSLHGRLIVCPRVDGVADSIKRIYLNINGDDNGVHYHREITNPDDPWIELVRCAAESVTRWEVCCIQGKVEPVKVWFTLKE